MTAPTHLSLVVVLERLRNGRVGGCRRDDGALVLQDVGLGARDGPHALRRRPVQVARQRV